MPVAIRIGRWSYSLYLWHSVVLMCVVALLPSHIWRPALVDGRMSLLWDAFGIPAVLAISVTVAGLSYTYVEMPMVALRRRFGSHAIRDGTPARKVHDASPSPVLHGRGRS